MCVFVFHNLFKSDVGWELDCMNIWASDRFQQYRAYNDHTHSHKHKLYKHVHTFTSNKCGLTQSNTINYCKCPIFLLVLSCYSIKIRSADFCRLKLISTDLLVGLVASCIAIQIF